MRSDRIHVKAGCELPFTAFVVSATCVVMLFVFCEFVGCFR